MKFFVDTADIEEIKKAASLGILDGVTTNPTLMARVGITGTKNIYRHYQAICDIVDGDISAEVLSTNYEQMIKEGDELAALHKNIVVKVPVTADGISALKYFTKKGIRTNCTLVFSAGQALVAAKAGATYISPFIGRIDDTGYDGLLLIRTIADIFRQQAMMAKILAASVRSSNHIIASAVAGAHVCTAPWKVLASLLHHPLTNAGVQQFEADAAKLTLKN